MSTRGKRRPRAFDLPELLSLVCSFSDVSDCVQLSQICRAGFYAASPFVWEHVEGAHHLLVLLPGIKITRPSPGYFQIVPRRSPFVDTERFSLYAPYVKVLDVFSDVIQGYYVSNWDLLLDYSRQHTLLPNLVTLSLRSKYSTHHPVIPLWGALFASSSLRDLLFTRDPFESAPETPQSAVKTLVKCLADKSPRLRTLSIFAESDDVYDDNDGQLEFLPPVREHPLDRALVYITGIRDLCCNLVFLGGKGMDIIGKVPHLESLTIHSDIYVADYSLVTTLPDDSFPSLQQLNLCLSDHEDFATIFKIRPMFSKITTLNICPQDCRVTFPSSVWLVTELFPSLKNVPYLQNLKISFGPTASKRQSYKLAVSRVSNLMSRLPLKSLSLSPAILDFSTLSGLGTTWAQLTYLELPQNYATTSMLAPFAELPKLQHLVIFLHLCLDFGNSYPPGRSNPLPFHTLEASVQSLTYGKDIPARDCPFLHGPFINNCPCAHRVDRLDRIANFLLSLWPKLRHVVWPEGDEETPELIRLLNQRLQSLENLDEPKDTDI